MPGVTPDPREPSRPSPCVETPAKHATRKQWENQTDRREGGRGGGPVTLPGHSAPEERRLWPTEPGPARRVPQSPSCLLQRADTPHLGDEPSPLAARPPARDRRPQAALSTHNTRAFTNGHTAKQSLEITILERFRNSLFLSEMAELPLPVRRPPARSVPFTVGTKQGRDRRLTRFCSARPVRSEQLPQLALAASDPVPHTRGWVQGHTGSSVFPQTRS